MEPGGTPSRRTPAVRSRASRRAGFTHSPGGYHQWVEWITEMMSALGAVGAGLAVALENVFTRAQ